MNFRPAFLAVIAAARLAADEPAISLCDAPVTETARKYIGTPYVRAGESPARGFDCSGFTRYVFAHSCGFDLPRSSGGQSRAGVKIERDALQPGDLVVFREPRRLHMGLYLGEGKFIHSPNRRGAVRVESMQSGHYRKAFREGRRVLEPVDLTGIFQLAKKVEAPPVPEPAVKKTPVKKTPVKKASVKRRAPAKKQTPAGSRAKVSSPARKQSAPR
jgi:hypothetical protein